MKTYRHLRAGFIAALFLLNAGFSAAIANAHEGHDHATSVDSDASAAAAKAKASYPLDTCVVSGDKLEGGDMGPPIDYVYKEGGKPDRLVRLCCKHCIKDFNKDPAAYLKKIDEAAAGKAKSSGL